MAPKDLSGDQFLRSLEKQRDVLDTLIKSYRAYLAVRVESSALMMDLTRTSPEHPMSYELASPTWWGFQGKSVSEALEHYLSGFTEARSPKQITEDLKNGGVQSKAKNLYATIMSALHRLAAEKKVEKVGKSWRWVKAA